jgi:hypothetical protein
MRSTYDGPVVLAGASGADRDIAGRRSWSDSPPARTTQLARRDDILRRLRRKRAIVALHRLGPRVLAELLDEIGRHHGIADDIGARVVAYAALDPAMLRAVGADRFAPLPLHRVEDGR